MFCYIIFLDFHFNSNKRITRANQNSWLCSYKNTNLILKSTEWMTSTFLILSASFSSTNCCFSSGITLNIVSFCLRLHLCVVVFAHKKENWQCFSCLLSRHFCTMLWSHAVMYPVRSTILLKCIISGRSRGGAPAEAQRAEKNFFKTRRPLISGTGWPGPPLSEDLDPPLIMIVIQWYIYIWF